MKFTLMFLVLFEILVLFVAFAKGLRSTNILFDVTELTNIASQPGPENYQANAALDAIIKENNYTSLLYYKAGNQPHVSSTRKDKCILTKKFHFITFYRLLPRYKY